MGRKVTVMTQPLKVSLIGMLMISFWLMIVPPLLAEEPETAQSAGEFDSITLNDQSYEKDRQGPVGFPHKKHALGATSLMLLRFSRSRESISLPVLLKSSKNNVNFL